MKAKLLALILALTMVVTLFAACGGTQEAPAEDTAPTADTTTGEEAADGKKFEGVEVSYAGTFAEAELQAVWVKEMGDLWAEETGGTVDFDFIGRDNLNSVRSDLLTGNAPDIIDQDLSELTGALLTSEVLLEPLDDILASNPYEDGAAITDNLNGAYELYTHEGVNYFVPYIYITSGFFYDKTMFAENNLTVPTTWDEFIEVNETLKAAGIAPLAADGNISFYNCYYFQALSQRLLGAGAFYNAALDETGESWDDPAFLQAAEMVYELSKSGSNYFQDGYAGSAFPAAQSDWAMGGAGMVYCGTWIPLETSNMTEEDFEFGFFPFPSVEGGKGDATIVEAQLMGFSVPADAKNKDAAKDFIAFCSTKEAADRLVELSNNMSARTDAIYPEVLQDVKPIVDSATGYHKNFDGAMSAAPEWWATVFYPADDALFFGDITPEEFIEQMKTETAKFYENKQ